MIRAVICDDEKAALNIIQYFIESEHYPIKVVGTAENGWEASELIEKEEPDLVFMDIQMPYMDGFQVIETVSSSKIIVITAYDSFQYAQKALRLGVSDIISKPIEFDQLRQAISRAIGWNFTGNEIVNQLLAYIHLNFSEKIELHDLSGMTHCTESHISRLFKKHIGMTIIAYIHKVRIEQAIHFLKTEHMTIQSAAMLCGYNNLNNFYKYFKKYTGTTPASLIGRG